MKKLDKLEMLITKRVQNILAEGKKLKMEGSGVENCKGIDHDDIGQFYVVMTPKDSMDQKYVFVTDVLNFADKIKNGLNVNEIRSIVRKEETARRIGERLMKERVSAVTNATKKAEGLKALKDEVLNKFKTLKKTKQETLKAVQQLKEAEEKSNYVGPLKGSSTLDEKGTRTDKAKKVVANSGKSTSDKKKYGSDEHFFTEKKKPSAGLTKAQKSSVEKKAHKGQNIGHGNFNKVAQAAGGGEKGIKIASASMWRNIKRK